jgi:hypothetical protein
MILLAGSTVQYGAASGFLAHMSVLLPMPPRLSTLTMEVNMSRFGDVLFSGSESQFGGLDAFGGTDGSLMKSKGVCCASTEACGCSGCGDPCISAEDVPPTRKSPSPSPLPSPAPRISAN